MSTMRTPAAPLAPRLAPEHATAFFHHVPLPEADRWRCAWRGRGFGTVMARIELAGFVQGYEVELDAGGGIQERALPSEVRPLPGVIAAADDHRTDRLGAGAAGRHPERGPERAPVLALVPDAPPRSVVFDDLCGWLVVEQRHRGGLPTLTVVEEHADRARAERAAGWHARPAEHWLLHDPALGWRRCSGHGWMHEPDVACCFTREQALRIAATEPGLQLHVLRADGRITCPDVPSRAAQAIDGADAEALERPAPQALT